MGSGCVAFHRSLFIATCDLPSTSSSQVLFMLFSPPILSLQMIVQPCNCNLVYNGVPSQLFSNLIIFLWPRGTPIIHCSVDISIVSSYFVIVHTSAQYFITGQISVSHVFGCCSVIIHDWIGGLDWLFRLP